MPPLSPPPFMALLGCFYNTANKDLFHPDASQGNGAYDTLADGTLGDRIPEGVGFRVGWQQKHAVTNCVNRCTGHLRHRFMYMALTDGDLCFCADSYKRVGAAAVSMCASDIGYCELEYGCGGKGVFSIYNLSTHYDAAEAAELPASERNYDGDACPDNKLPVVIDTYISPVTLDSLEYGQELSTGCNENTTDIRCTLTSANGRYTMTFLPSGSLAVTDSHGGVIWESTIPYATEGPWRLRFGDHCTHVIVHGLLHSSHCIENILMLDGLYIWSRTNPRISSRVRHTVTFNNYGRSTVPSTGKGKMVLDNFGGLMIIDAIGMV